MEEVLYESPVAIKEAVENVVSKGMLEKLEVIFIASPLLFFIILLVSIFLIFFIFYITLEILEILKKRKDSNYLNQIKKILKEIRFYYKDVDLKILFEISSRKELEDLANLLKEANTKEKKVIILEEVFEIKNNDIEAYKNEIKNKTKKIFRKN